MSLTFSLKYLVNFCKASALSTQVKICLSNEVPLLVEYSIGGTSWLRFYLAPKVGSFITSPCAPFVVPVTGSVSLVLTLHLLQIGDEE